MEQIDKRWEFVFREGFSLVFNPKNKYVHKTESKTYVMNENIAGEEML